MLVDGRWTGAWHPFHGKDAKGGFVRQHSSFRNWVTPDGAPGPTGAGGFAAQSGRYHLYAALICPWACRTLMMRALKGLQPHITVSIVEPALTDEGWRFGAELGADADPILGATYMHQIYTAADPHVTGRATVPVLWDRQTRTIVNNESSEIVRMFNSGFGTLAAGSDDFYPEALRAQIDVLNESLYEKLNNGVYRAGFATTQEAYDLAVRDVFAMLDSLEAQLSEGPYLFGASLTESDIRLFVTLVRFDAAYHGLFKCNLRRLVDYPRLHTYMRRILAIDGIAETVNIAHIKHGYYSIRALNPSGIVPIGPESCTSDHASH